jgi:hypothetical protein
MDIAIIQDDQVVEIGHYKKLFPATSFPTTGPNADFMLDNSALGVTIWKAHDKATQKLISSEPYIEDNQVFTVVVADKTEDEMANDLAVEANIARIKRNELLTQSDWTQTLDAPVDKILWASYRQELRDITKQTDFPLNIEWPVVSN